MPSFLLAGATGHLGRAIAAELSIRNLPFTALVRSPERAKLLSQFTGSFRYAEASDTKSYKGVCEGQEIVISALGKSVSPNDRSKPSFMQVDRDANSALIDDAVAHSVQKFIYVSAFHADQYPDLNYFRVHHDIEEKLKSSGLDWIIVRPPALFSAFTDLIGMARKGRLVNIGPGDKKTNPIDERDLAGFILDNIVLSKAILDAGGKEILTRRGINELIQTMAAPARKLRSIPVRLVKCTLPLISILSQNAYDKFAFFTEVLQHDLITKEVGERTLRDYLREKI
jgi:uncharacterized protein YbjT (DUF2867 family)